MFKFKDLITTGLYKREEDALKDALRALLWVHPEYRLELAINTYQQGEISLSKAAQMAGLCFEEICEIIKGRGIKLGLGVESKEDLEREVEILRGKLNGIHRK